MQNWIDKICGGALEIAGRKSLFGKLHEKRHTKDSMDGRE
jgi:hypothetical protein